MLRKTATVLICAAAVTFVAAQMPWETAPGTESSGDEMSSSSDPYSSSSDEGSSEESSFGGFSSYTSEESGGESTEDVSAAEKPKRERAPRSAAAGFNSQKSCPVCNSTKIKHSLFVEHSGQKIHVCCASCIGRVKRNPDAFVKVLQKRGESPE